MSEPDTRVYIFQDLNAPVCKIGISNSPKKRMRDVSCSSGRYLKIAWVSAKLERVDAFKLETYLHYTYSKYRLPGEWFSLKASDVIPIANLAVGNKITYKPSRGAIEDMTCPHCSSLNVIGNGFTKGGSRRSRCKDCKKSWSGY